MISEHQKPDYHTRPLGIPFYQLLEQSFGVSLFATFTSLLWKPYKSLQILCISKAELINTSGMNCPKIPK